MDKSLINVAENAHFYAFYTGFEEGIDGLKVSSFYFVQTLFRFNRNSPTWRIRQHVLTKLEQQTKCSTLKDASTNRTSTSVRFEQPETKLIRTMIGKETRLSDSIGKKQEPLLLLPLTSPSVSDSPIDVKIRTLATNRTEKTKNARNDERYSRVKYKNSS